MCEGFQLNVLAALLGEAINGEAAADVATGHHVAAAVIHETQINALMIGKNVFNLIESKFKYLSCYSNDEYFTIFRV